MDRWTNLGRARSRSRLVVRLCAALTVTLATPAGAQTSTTSSADLDRPEARRWWTLWSLTSHQSRAIWGMWTLHINHVDDGWSNDRAGALIYRGGFAASWRTTHGGRAWAMGFERAWLTAGQGPFEGMLGFRFGAGYGYDEQLGWLAREVPVLPFAQPIAYGRVGRLTMDVGYTWVVLSLTAGVRF